MEFTLPGRFEAEPKNMKRAWPVICGRTRFSRHMTEARDREPLGVFKVLTAGIMIKLAGRLAMYLPDAR